MKCNTKNQVSNTNLYQFNYLHTHSHHMLVWMNISMNLEKTHACPSFNAPALTCLPNPLFPSF